MTIEFTDTNEYKGFTKMNRLDGTLLFPPQARLELVAGLTFEYAHPQPNWWWRMWQWVLLGWKWEKVK